MVTFDFLRLILREPSAGTEPNESYSCAYRECAGKRAMLWGDPVGFWCVSTRFW